MHFYSTGINCVSHVLQGKPYYVVVYQYPRYFTWIFFGKFFLGMFLNLNSMILTHAKDYFCEQNVPNLSDFFWKKII